MAFNGNPDAKNLAQQPRFWDAVCREQACASRDGHLVFVDGIDLRGSAESIGTTLIKDHGAISEADEVMVRHMIR